MNRKLPLKQFSTEVTDAVVIVLLERIGDIVACEPVIGYAKKQWPDRPLAWVTFAKYAELLESHPDLDYIVTAKNLGQATRWSQGLPKGCRVINLHHHRQPCPITREVVFNSNDPDITFFNYFDYGSLLEAFSRSAGLPVLSDAPRFHVSPEILPPELPSPYLVFHCLSSDTCKDWDPDKWQDLFGYFARRQVVVAEVGQERVIQTDSPFYHDLTQVNTLQGVAGLIEGASFFVGIDSGFAHMANALGVEGAIIMGAYSQWQDHVPFTGRYSRGRIVRHPQLPARYVAVEKVIERYRALVSGGKMLDAVDHRQIQKPAVDGRNDLKFPNTAQRLVLKCYRPFVKWLAPTHEYNLFKANPGLFFARPGGLKPAVMPMRHLLRLLGTIPPQVEADLD